ncbi:hydrogenase maturation protease [Hyphomicrobium sp. 2TAF46]|uniref:hydrogenase maturation protease n=1 Tax=Hyphomicrobium sp. 2TAF46 TaxID=3233019 RepID=UPI003F918A9C
MIAVIGCGNANRKDDAVGIEVIRLLRSRNDFRGREDVRLLDAGTDGMSVMYAARGCDALIIVDSSRTGSEPGSVFEVPGRELEAPHVPSLNLHDFRWDHALFAGRQLYREQFPSDVTVYLIEARDLELGLGLSSEIDAAARTVADRIAARIGAFALSNAAGAA